MKVIKPWTYKMSGDELECVMAAAKGVINYYVRSNIYTGLNVDYNSSEFCQLENIKKRIMKEKDKTKEYWEEEVNKASIALAKKYNIEPCLI